MTTTGTLLLAMGSESMTMMIPSTQVGISEQQITQHQPSPVQLHKQH
jgi:hypothetical protein